jgi:hypothetical protein
MWTTLALASLLSLPAGQSDKLALTNVRSTYGVLGAAKPDNKVLPGDSYVLSFDIDGVKVDETGKVLYSVGMEVLDSQGKVQFKQEPRDLEANASLGGNVLPAFAMVNIGTEQAAGKYNLKVTVTDRASRQTTSVSHDYEILPKAFGLVHVNLTSDSEGKIAAPFLSVGESAWVNFTVVGFGRNGASQQPDLAVSLRVLDENGKPTLAKPFTGKVDKDVPAKAQSIPLQFDIELNRPGKFTIELVANDKVNGKEAKITLPLQVMKSK